MSAKLGNGKKNYYKFEWVENNLFSCRKAFEITEEPEIVSQKTRKPLLKDLNNCLVFNSFGSTAIQITEKNHSNDLHGSITSLASSTSTISQKVCKLKPSLDI